MSAGARPRAGRSARDPATTRERLLDRVVRLGQQGLSRDWLIAYGAECFGDWQAAVDDLVESGLVERRPVYRWGMSPPGRATTIVYYPRSRRV